MGLQFSPFIAPLCLMLFAQADNMPLDLTKPTPAAPSGVHPVERQGTPSPGAPSGEPEKILHVVGNIGITESTVQAQGQLVEIPHASGWGEGYLVGRPVDVVRSDKAQDILEVSVNAGAFGNTGQIIQLSASFKEMFDVFNALDHNKEYIFGYKNPEVDRKDYRVLKEIATPETFLKNQNIKLLPQKVLAGDGYTGTLASGNHQGYLMNVQRLRLQENTCVIEFAGGPEQTTAFNVLDAEVCTYAQKLLAFRQRVQVSYTQDIIGSTESSFFARGLEIVMPEKTLQGERFTPMQIEQLDKELFTDQKLLELKRRMRELPE